MEAFKRRKKAKNQLEPGIFGGAKHEGTNLFLGVYSHLDIKAALLAQGLLPPDAFLTSL